MPKDFDTMEDSNRSSNPSIHELSGPDRRTVLQGSAALAARLLLPLGGAAALASCAAPGTGAPRAAGPLIGFRSVPPSAADGITVPEGYVAQVLAPWGEPVGIAGRLPAFRDDAGNSAADQEAQMGMHHDGIHFYPLEGSRRGLLVMNHEYTDDGLLHTDGMRTWSPEKVRKAQAAHGVAVIEVEEAGGRWQVVRPSRYARRIHANTPMAFGGPAAGHPLVRTAADPQGVRPVGTFNNCGSTMTPWGTYLTSEENFMGYFDGPQQPDAHGRRWGLRAGGAGYRWHEFDERFDAKKHPNEPNRHGWLVEIDPFDPQSVPVKRTALGRGAHECGLVTAAPDGRAIVYAGEDARFEGLYRFVSRDRIRPGGLRGNATLLDHGTLFMARFHADGTGEWMPLVHGRGPLVAANGFADQGEVVVKTRQAGDLLGATKMDRPEWIAIDADGWVYAALTNNSSRGADGMPGPDAANPRANNTMGHIIRWKDEGGPDGLRFRWNHFVLAGDPQNARPDAKGNVKGDAFACPDGLWVDPRGVLWIQTDMSTSFMGRGEAQRLGNNVMLAADPRTGEVRRFLTGPVGCEVTGATMTPDGRTMFINIQHPGETPSERSDPDQPRRWSNWPAFRPGGRPRSATVVIRRADGGLVGT